LKGGWYGWYVLQRRLYIYKMTDHEMTYEEELDLIFWAQEEESAMSPEEELGLSYWLQSPEEENPKNYLYCKSDAVEEDNPINPVVSLDPM